MVPVVGGSNPVPDPSQASEKAGTDAAMGGTWSAEVGAQQDNCGDSGMSYFYSNTGPVPYRMVLTAS